MSERIQSILTENGWNRNRLAKESGIPKSFISVIMNNNANLTLETILKIENALGTPILKILKPKKKRES